MEHLRTVKEPKQPIPTFVETVALLMKVEGFNLSNRPDSNLTSVYSPKIDMCYLISTSNSKMILIDYFLLYTKPFPLTRIGRRTWRLD